ncbi:hypothetical protein CEXT_14491 [Caerostris extrusa]|uniref:Uncharacterized protein n=1 Tax=Caerostris extrusa TaxID=172846 RepID=A0AAV4WYW9_CAEEX|nr:hypothetical protein CEXT_14491 [Caerostris extrusa]
MAEAIDGSNNGFTYLWIIRNFSRFILNDSNLYCPKQFLSPTVEVDLLEKRKCNIVILFDARIIVVSCSIFNKNDEAFEPEIEVELAFLADDGTILRKVKNETLFLLAESSCSSCLQTKMQFLDRRSWSIYQMMC